MKKILSFLLLFVLVLGISACREAEAPDTDPAGPVSASSATDSGDKTGKTDAATDTASDPPASGEAVFETAEEVLAASQHYVGLCDQRNGRVVIRDLAVTDWTDDSSIVWEYKHDIQGRENYGWIAGLKFRHSEYYGGDVMLFCAPRSMGYIVSMETKQVLLAAEKAGANPHSVELLPNGTFIVGSSNDGTVTVYAPGETKSCFTLQLAGNDKGTPDVHGVLWDPKNETLWVAGGEKLRAFLVIGPENSPELVQYAEYDSPHGAIHDLLPIYGDPDSLVLTTSGGAIRFDKENEKFSYNYSCSAVGQRYEYMPGCGLYADGVLTFTAITKETKVYQDWDTNYVFACIPYGKERRKVIRYHAPDDAYYKLRIFDTNYQ